SGPTERQQFKWTVFAAAVVIAVTASTAVLGALDPTLSLGYRPGDLGVLFELLSLTLFALAVLCIPFALVISILRYRLWDIDLLINRTLVYVPLTGIVAGLYAATVALFQKI